MKIKNLLIGLLTCVLVTFLFNNGAKSNEPSIENGFMVPRFIYVCFLDYSNPPTVTVIRYINGLYDATYKQEKKLEGEVAKIRMVCSDQTTPEVDEPRVWIEVNYQKGDSALLETYPGKDLYVRGIYKGSTGGVSLASDGSAGLVAVNYGDDSPQIERWQLTDLNASPTIIPVNINLPGGNIIDIAANIVNGQYKIWCMLQGATKKVYEKNGDSDFSFLMERAEGTWSMGDNGTVCWLARQVSANFIDGQKQVTQPIVEWFAPGESEGTKWRYLVPKANTESGVTLGKSRITYVDNNGDICIVTYSAKFPNLPKWIVLQRPLPQPPQSRYVTATRTEIGYDKK